MIFRLLSFSIVFITLCIFTSAAEMRKTLQITRQNRCVTNATKNSKPLFGVIKSSKTPNLSFDQNDNDSDIFARMILDSGLRHTLFKKGKFTVFVPRDLAMKQTAFDILDHEGKQRMGISQMTEAITYKIISDFIESYQNPNLVRKSIVRNHVIRGQFSLCDLIEKRSWTTKANKQIILSGVTLITESNLFNHPMLYILGSKFFDIRTRNGYIHSIDRLLMPNLSSFQSRADQ